MHQRLMKRSQFIVCIFLSTIVLIFISRCSEQPPSDARGEQYAGSAACAKCHIDIALGSLHDSHALTSQFAKFNEGSALRSNLQPGSFVFNEKTKVDVILKDDALHQIAIVNNEKVKEEKAWMIFGSGKYAYTFAYWYEKGLMQMPLNYLVPEHQWVNSPGFPSDQIYYGRTIQSKCLECHASYAEVQMKFTSGQVQEEFRDDAIIAGIDCERCHGPAKQHVEHHLQNPKANEAHYIVNYQALSRDQRMDMCGTCHAGIGLQLVGSSFFVKPGDTVKTLPDFARYAGEEHDVHGYQRQLLEASKCYVSSKLECVSCHKIHDSKNKTIALYSKDCIDCHQEVKHFSLTPQKRRASLANCIDCHMPEKASENIGFQKSGSKEKFPYTIRTHHIAIH